MPMLLKNLTFPPKLTAQNPQNAPSRAKNMGRLKIPVFLTPGRECRQQGYRRSSSTPSTFLEALVGKMSFCTSHSCALNGIGTRRGAQYKV